NSSAGQRERFRSHAVLRFPLRLTGNRTATLTGENMTHDKLLHHCIISTVEKLHVGDTPEHGEKCSLKRHFLGCPREVVGYLDNEAKRNPRRFVWVKVDRIVKNALK